MTRPIDKLCWNIWWFDPSSKEIIKRNVFSLSIRFRDNVQSLFDQEFSSFDCFSDALRSCALYSYWAKAEHEIIVEPFVSDGECRKVDVYSQLDLNWKRFAIYVYSIYLNSK